MNIQDTLNNLSDGITDADGMVEQMTYMMFGSVVTTTKGFENVEIKLDAESQRVFICVTVRWFARMKRMEAVRKYWLAKAERRVKKYIPYGWKVLIYYKQGEENE